MSMLATPIVVNPDMAGVRMSPEEFDLAVSPTGERTVAEHEVYETPLLPGFALPLARILAAADEWA
jgi:hypothetical protein